MSRGGNSETECALSVNLKDERLTRVSEVKTEHRVCEYVLGRRFSLSIVFQGLPVL